jgi:hypothetical protein
MHLDSASGRHYVFLVYSQGNPARFASFAREGSALPALPYPERWSAKTPFLKMSAPEPLPIPAPEKGSR